MAKKKLFPWEIWGFQDATKELVLNVMRCDAGTSTRRDHKHCLLANATKRLLGAQADPHIGKSRAFVNHGTEDKPRWLRYMVSASTREQVRAFDIAGIVKPALFTLREMPKPRKRSGKSINPGSRPKRRKRVYVPDVRVSLI